MEIEIIYFGPPPFSIGKWYTAACVSYLWSSYRAGKVETGKCHGDGEIYVEIGSQTSFYCQRICLDIRLVEVAFSVFHCLNVFAVACRLEV